MNLHELGIQGGLEKAAASTRKRGPWKRGLMRAGGARGSLSSGGKFGKGVPGRAGPGMKAADNVYGSSKTAAFTPALFQQAMRVAASVVKEMSPAMLSGAMTGAAVSAIRADSDKGSAAVKGALMGSLVGGVLGTGGALGMASSQPHYRELQNTIGLITGGVSGFYTDVQKDKPHG